MFTHCTCPLVFLGRKEVRTRFVDFDRRSVKASASLSVCQSIESWGSLLNMRTDGRRGRAHHDLSARSTPECMTWRKRPSSRAHGSLMEGGGTRPKCNEEYGVDGKRSWGPKAIYRALTQSASSFVAHADGRGHGIRWSNLRPVNHRRKYITITTLCSGRGRGRGRGRRRASPCLLVCQVSSQNY